MNSVTESGEQQALIDWANIQVKTGAHPKLRWLFAIPNGGKRDKRTAARLRAEGVRAGVPDLFLSYPVGKYHGLFIELKVGHNQLSEEQREWIGHLAHSDYKVVVAHGFEQARDALVEYLAGAQKDWRAGIKFLMGGGE